MTTATHQEKIDALNAQINSLSDERTNIRDGIEHATKRLEQARAELARTHASLKAGRDVAASDLLNETRDVSDLEETLEHLQQTSGARLALLDEQVEKLRAEMAKATQEKRKAALSEATMAYQAALLAALPLADTLLDAAKAAGVTIPKDAPLLVRRGFHKIGGVHIDLGLILSGQ
jgi:chromosome segregation ATPase